MFIIVITIARYYMFFGWFGLFDRCVVLHPEILMLRFADCAAVAVTVATDDDATEENKAFAYNESWTVNRVGT